MQTSDKDFYFSFALAFAAGLARTLNNVNINFVNYIVNGKDVSALKNCAPTDLLEVFKVIHHRPQKFSQNICALGVGECF